MLYWFCICFLSLKLEISFDSFTFFQYFEIPWPFRQIRRIVNKKFNRTPGRASNQNWAAGASASRVKSHAFAAAWAAQRFDISLRTAQHSDSATSVWNEQFRLNVFKNAKKSNYLTFSYIWQRLAGNLKILPRSSRYKSGLVMVKCFRCNFFWVILNCKTNQICETTWMKL